MSSTSAVSNPMKPTLQLEQHESCEVELGHDDDTVEDAESQTAVAITAKLGAAFDARQAQLLGEVIAHEASQQKVGLAAKSTFAWLTEAPPNWCNPAVSKMRCNVPVRLCTPGYNLRALL